MMTFKLKPVVVRIKEEGEEYKILSSHPFLPTQPITREVLEEHFDPVNNEALNFVDPDRVERISK